jgi:hypothetical protein
MTANAAPTLRSVREKLERGGALFASDEVQVLWDELERRAYERAEMLETIRVLQRSVRTDRA